MAFKINAHVILSGPKNIKAVAKDIQKQLGGISTTIKLDIPKDLSRQLGAFNKGLTSLTSGLRDLQSAATRSVTDLKKVSTEFKDIKKRKYIYKI